jgi:hypothetical protein
VNRVIRKSKAQSALEAFDMLNALFTAELVSPSKCLWLVSPWISDIEIIDNSAGTYPVFSRYGRRPIRLAETLVTLAANKTNVVVATTSDSANDTFVNRLRKLARDSDVDRDVLIQVDTSRKLHTKALTGDDYAVSGSMNITYSGIKIREEQVELKTDAEYVAQARMDAFGRFGGKL